MKLPTLNVDVAVNTKTMQKGIAEANKQLEKVGKKGLALAGGGFGKIGSLAELGGGMGMGAIGVGGIGLAAMAPFKIASFGLSLLADSTKRGKEAMDSFASGNGLTGGLDLGTAARLAAADERARADATAASPTGLVDTFFGAMLNEQGQMGGIAGLVRDWMNATAEGTKWLAAFSGGVLGGLQDGYAAERADMAISRSAAGAQAYMTTWEIDAMQRRIDAEKERKQKREIET